MSAQSAAAAADLELVRCLPQLLWLHEPAVLATEPGILCLGRCLGVLGVDTRAHHTICCDPPHDNLGPWPDDPKASTVGNCTPAYDASRPGVLGPAWNPRTPIYDRDASTLVPHGFLTI